MVCLCFEPVGTFAVISLMIGGVAVREAPEPTESSLFQAPANASNISTVFNEDLNAKRVQVAAVLTTLVGIIQVSLETTISFSYLMHLVFAVCM